MHVIPPNGFPNVPSLADLDDIAKQIKNMPTFTSNDRAFLEEIPAFPTVDGLKVLSATTYNGETSLSYEEIENELPTYPIADGVKVLTATTTSGETVLSWEDSSNGVIDYSTTEQATGQKWIDGKDIFFKTVAIDNPVSTGTPTSINHGADVDKIVKIDGHGEISGVFIPITYYASANYYSMVYVSSTTIVYDVKWDTTQFTKLLVTIYYTKALQESEE